MQVSLLLLYGKFKGFLTKSNVHAPHDTNYDEATVVVECVSVVQEDRR